jgi:hypothetical protein
MDGIMTGEQHWIAARRAPAGTSREERGASARGRPGSFAGDREPLRRPTERRASPAWRRLAAAWARGWTAFAAATGEPYLSLAGRMELRTVKEVTHKESSRVEHLERPQAGVKGSGGCRSAEPADILGEAPAVG